MIDWDILDRLREGFLGSSAPAGDYWQSPEDLANYDFTFAQRIAWKWQYVLDELSRRGWSPPGGAILDFACGSGVASRCFIRHFGAPSELRLHDRSRMAMDFAAGRAREAFPELPVRTADTLHELPDDDIGVLLVSHVITELSPAQLDAVVALARRATAVVWVEPGTHQASRAVIDVRERLRGEFSVVAPCTHQECCGMLVPQNDRHWCHHFATAPPFVHTDSNWVRFGKMAGIDLRSLPLSFIVMDRRPAPALPTGATRLIGQSRVYKAYSLLMCCDTSSVRDRRLMKRHLGEQYRLTKKQELDVLLCLEYDGQDIVAAKSL